MPTKKRALSLKAQLLPSFLVEREEKMISIILP